MTIALRVSTHFASSETEMSVVNGIPYDTIEAPVSVPTMRASLSSN
jgi:hypothetical protein